MLIEQNIWNGILHLFLSVAYQYIIYPSRLFLCIRISFYPRPPLSLRLKKWPFDYWNYWSVRDPYYFTNMICDNFPAMFSRNTYFCDIPLTLLQFHLFRFAIPYYIYVYVHGMKFRFPDVVADSVRKDAELSFGAESANDYVLSVLTNILRIESRYCTIYLNIP